MQTMIVWIFGTSAAGKETFIKYCVEKNPLELFSLLNWTGRTVIPCQESIDWVAQYYGDPRGPKREELLQVIQGQARQHPEAVVLIKGQDLDLYANRLIRLKGLLPTHDHQVIFLDGDINEQFERWKQKPWYVPSFSIETVKSQICSQVRMLQKQPLSIRSLYVASIGNYSTISFPPRLTALK